MRKANKRYAFLKGWGALRRDQQAAFKLEFMKEFDVKSERGFYDRLNGIVEPRVSEAETIAALFKRYGITDYWGGQRVQTFRSIKRRCTEE